MRQKNIPILVVVWLMVITCIITSTITLLTTGQSLLGTRWVSREEYEIIQRYARLDQVRQALNDEFVLEIDDATLVTGALKGMMAILGDPYTHYYTAEEMQEYQQETQGEYKGLGMLVQNNAHEDIEVIRIYAKSPAENAGIQVGDCILRVNGVAVRGTNAQTLADAVLMMKGEAGTDVTLTIRRDGKTMDFTLQYGDVSINNVNCSMLDNGLAYIDIFQFTGDAVSGFESAIETVLQEGAKGLVIDLRNNPGGLLTDVVDIADLLLPEGIIVYTEDRYGSRTDYYSDAECLDLPMAILINEASASASEILAAAVQDHKRGTIVGTKSYGKGVVQTIIIFEDDGAGMQYTSSYYYTPNGQNINGTGVMPDLLIEAGEGFKSYSGIPDPENDVQLQMAIDVLLREIQSGE